MYESKVLSVWMFHLIRLYGLLKDVLVVCIKFLEIFNNSKVDCELQNVMLDYSLFCSEKFHWCICIRNFCWSVHKILSQNVLHFCSFLVIEFCETWRNKLTFLFKDKISPLLFCLWQFQILSLLPRNLDVETHWHITKHFRNDLMMSNFITIFWRI
jgi:hypothetical protein